MSKTTASKESVVKKTIPKIVEEPKIHLSKFIAIKSNEYTKEQAVQVSAATSKKEMHTVTKWTEIFNHILTRRVK